MGVKKRNSNYPDWYNQETMIPYCIIHLFRVQIDIVLYMQVIEWKFQQQKIFYNKYWSFAIFRNNNKFYLAFCEFKKRNSKLSFLTFNIAFFYAVAQGMRFFFHIFDLIIRELNYRSFFNSTQKLRKLNSIFKIIFNEK